MSMRTNLYVRGKPVVSPTPHKFAPMAEGADGVPKIDWKRLSTACDLFFKKRGLKSYDPVIGPKRFTR